MNFFGGTLPEQFINIPRLYTALAQWLSVSIYIFFNRKRFEQRKSIFLSVLFLIIFISFHYWVDSWNINFWVLGMILSVVLMYLYTITLAKLDYLKAGYIAAISFVISEFAASLEWQLEYFLLSSFDNIVIRVFLFTPIPIYHFRITLFFILTFLIIFYGMFTIELRYQRNRKSQEISLNDFLSILSIVIVVFAISNMSFLDIRSPITSDRPSEIFYIRTLVNFVGIIILYSQREHCYSTQKGLEVHTMRGLIDKQYEQFMVSKEAMDVVNQKYHDLKHHINVIKHETNYEQKMKHLDKLEESINLYGATYNTGNKILDIILNTKRDLIIQNKINFTCVADGSILNQIPTIDLVSIFGNSFDNAIENLTQIKDFEKRLLKLTIFKKINWIIIKLENYYQNELFFENGSLISSKGDSLFHGFGIKSIRSTVEKHNGTVTIDTSDNWFTLLITIPINETLNHSIN
ncbi:MAG: ATP-binding protein [Acholeplasmataceae bacterium]